MQLPPLNRFTNEEARNTWYAVFGVFALWWVFNLLSGLFGNLFRRRGAVPLNANNNAALNAGAGPGTVTTAVPVGRDSALHRIASALRDIFISSLAVVAFNYFTNGITHSFNILHWVVVVLGILWALARGPFHRFADILQFAIIPLYVTLWIFGFVHKSYLGHAID